MRPNERGRSEPELRQQWPLRSVAALAGMSCFNCGQLAEWGAVAGAARKGARAPAPRLSWSLLALVFSLALSMSLHAEPATGRLQKPRGLTLRLFLTLPAAPALKCFLLSMATHCHSLHALLNYTHTHTQVAWWPPPWGPPCPCP